MNASTTETRNETVRAERARLELFEAALDGVDVAAAGGVVVVRDGADTWLCREDEWDAAVRRVLDGSVRLRAGDDEEAEAENYSAFCAAIGGPILTLTGTPRGSREARAELLGAAIAADLIDDIDAERYGVEPSWPEGARPIR